MPFEHLNVLITFVKAVTRKLVLETLKRLVPICLLTTVLASMIAGSIYASGIVHQPTHALLRLAQGGGVLAVYLVLGLACGVLLSIALATHRTAQDLGQPLSDAVGALTADLMAELKLDVTPISVEEVTQGVDRAFGTLAEESRGRFGRFSPTRLVAWFYSRAIRKALKESLLGDFLLTLREQGETHVTAKNLESYLRTKAISLISVGVGMQARQAKFVAIVLVALILLLPVLILLAARAVSSLMAASSLADPGSTL